MRPMGRQLSFSMVSFQYTINPTSVLYEPGPISLRTLCRVSLAATASLRLGPDVQVDLARAAAWCGQWQSRC
eukprot:3159648-Rhodomonas_salina.1